MIAATALLLVQGLLVLLLAAWLTPGVLDNIRYPSINRDDVARVLRMEAVADWPEVKRLVGHRRIDDPRVVKVLFALIVAAELVAALLLWAGSAGLLGALAGFWAVEPARALALVGCFAFTGVWAGFLIGGQWFYYWYGAFGQQTHFLCTLWGIATLLVLLA